VNRVCVDVGYRWCWYWYWCWWNEQAWTEGVSTVSSVVVVVATTPYGVCTAWVTTNSILSTRPTVFVVGHHHCWLTYFRFFRIYSIPTVTILSIVCCWCCYYCWWCSYVEVVDWLRTALILLLARFLFPVPCMNSLSTNAYSIVRPHQSLFHCIDRPTSEAVVLLYRSWRYSLSLSLEYRHRHRDRCQIRQRSFVVAVGGGCWCWCCCWCCCNTVVGAVLISLALLIWIVPFFSCALNHRLAHHSTTWYWPLTLFPLYLHLHLMLMSTIRLDIFFRRCMLMLLFLLLLSMLLSMLLQRGVCCLWIWSLPSILSAILFLFLNYSVHITSLVSSSSSFLQC